MIPQPLNKEYVTIRREEYESLVDIAKRVDALKARGNTSIEIMQLRINRARRARRQS